MNDQQMLEILYPEPQPLTDSDRTSMRSELFAARSADSLPPRSDGDRAAVTAPDAVDDLGSTIRTDDDRRPDDDAGRRWLTVAAAAVLLAGTVGIWVAGTRSAGDTPALVQQPVNETTVSQPAPQTAQGLDPDTALSADDWLTVPADATDLEWQYAVDGDSGYANADTRSDQIVYGTTTDPELLIIHIHNPPLDPGIGSGVWAGYPRRDGWIETRQLGDTEITVQGADTVDPAIVDMLVVTPEQELTTEPLGVRDRATPVAAALHNGQEWTVLVERSGRYEMAYVEIRPSGNREPDVRMMAGPEPIPPDEELTVDYQPSRFAEGLSPGEVLAIGRAPSDVSSVNVEFSDGTVVNAATYPAAPDHSGRYWFAVTSLAGDSHDISVTNVTAAGLEGR